MVSSVSTPGTDFRFTHGKNNEFGTVYIWVTYSGPEAIDYHYPDPDLALSDDERQTDITKDDYKANGIYYVRNDQGADKQFEYFMPNYSQGITYPGLARINQSIEAYCYCILGAQARTRSSIQGISGGAKETQREFLGRIEDSIVLQNISDSIQRYQEAIADTKTRLDFAVAQGVWLMPSRMVINTESIVGYNNMLVITDASMKLGVNNNVNRETHKASLKHMAGGPSKFNPPNSHPANPIHKQAMQAQGLAPAKTPPQAPTATPAVAPPQAPTNTPAVAASVEPHHVNRALVAVGALALAGFVAWMR